MNAAHVHLIVNHAPVFGLIVGILLLAWGAMRNARDFRIAAYIVFILSALAAVVAYVSGLATESIVEDLPGIAESAIERHEEAATIALVLICAAGVAGVIGIIAERARLTLRRAAVAALFAVAIVALGAVGYTANLGGLIHHSEIAVQK